MVVLGANTPYTPITLEGLEADIAKLESLLSQAEACLVTCDGRTINISSLTTMNEEVVVHTVGTTVGGYISITVGEFEVPTPPLPNPEAEQFPPYNMLQVFRENGSFNVNTYQDAAGLTLCDTITIDTFAQTGITIPTVGSSTLFKTPAVFALPTCAGVLSYTELFAGAPPMTASVNTTTGDVTIPAQTLPSGTGRYYYYVTCTVLGVPTVIATCYLEVINI